MEMGIVQRYAGGEFFRSYGFEISGQDLTIP